MIKPDSPMRLFIRLLLGVSCLMPLATRAAGEALDLDEIVRNPTIGNYQAYAEFKMAHYDAARQIWQALAARGSGEAYFNLGILSEEGLGEAKDQAAALRYYLGGAEVGNAKAQYRLGLLQLVGVSGAADPDGARRWLSAAAGQGMEDAARLLAHLAATGGSAADQDFFRGEVMHVLGQHREAAQVWLALSEQGNAKARTRLAWLYETGQGVPRNLLEAARLFRLSAEAGEAEAQYALSVMLFTGKGQAANPAESRRWLERSAAQGYPAAKSALAAPLK